MAGVFTPAVREWQQVLRAPVFVPRRWATERPAENWDEGEQVCVRINRSWIPHIIGVMEALDQPDTWEGTDAEIEATREQVREIILAMMTGQECGDAMPAQYLKDLGGCSNGQLEFIRVIDGVEESIYLDLNSCLAIPDTYVASIDGCSNGNLLLTTVTDGNINSGGVNLAVCLENQFLTADDLPPTPEFSIIDGDLWVDHNADGVFDENLGRVKGDKGDTGDQGLPGIEGQPGQDGMDGTCPTECTTGEIIVPPPVIPGQTDDQTNCNIAGYITEQIAKDGLQQAIDAQNQAIGFANFASGILASLLGAATGGVLAPIVIGAANLLFTNVLNALVDAENTLEDDTFWSVMVCEIKCALAPDVGVTDDSFVRLVDAIRTMNHPNTNWRGYIADYIEALGAAVVSQATSIGAITAFDCTNCECDEDIDCPDPCTLSGNTVYDADFAGFAGGTYSTLANSDKVRLIGSSGTTLTIPEEVCVYGVQVRIYRGTTQTTTQVTVTVGTESRTLNIGNAGTYINVYANLNATPVREDTITVQTANGNGCYVSFVNVERCE